MSTFDGSINLGRVKRLDCGPTSSWVPAHPIHLCVSQAVPGACSSCLFPSVLQEGKLEGPRCASPCSLAIHEPPLPCQTSLAPTALVSRVLNTKGGPCLYLCLIRSFNNRLLSTYYICQTQL